MSKYLLAVAFVAAFVLAGCKQTTPEVAPSAIETTTTTTTTEEVMIDETVPTEEVMMEEGEKAVEDKMEKEEVEY